MLKSPLLWLAALWIGLAIHLDWHLGRPGHHADLSFGLPFHWLLALPAFAGLPVLARRVWPSEATRAGVAIVVLGVVLGQGLEPLAEVLTSPPGHAPFANTVRWWIFAEFLLAGMATFWLATVLTRRPSDLGDAKP
jgi:hypothetical protein